eukprot:Opistho-2@48511
MDRREGRRRHIDAHEDGGDGSDGSDGSDDDSSLSTGAWEQRRRMEVSELEEFERLERATSQQGYSRPDTLHAHPHSREEDNGRDRRGTAAEGRGLLHPPAHALAHTHTHTHAQAQSQAGGAQSNTHGRTHRTGATAPPSGGHTDELPLPVAVRRKMTELEDEIARFRGENARVAALRAEAEAEVHRMRTRSEEFEAYRAEETAKLRRERKVFETHTRSARASCGPERDFQAELSLLKQEVTALQDQMRLRDEKHSLAIARHKNRTNELSQKCAALDAEVVRLRGERDDLVVLVEKLTKTARLAADRSEVARARATLSPQTPTRRHSPVPPRALVTHVDATARTVGSDVSTRPDAPTRLVGGDVSTRTDAITVRSGDVSARPVGGDASARTPTVVSAPPAAPEEPHATQTADGTAVTTFPNGTRKEVRADGSSTVHFFNGDVKRTNPDGRVIYYYAESNTTHTTYADGLEGVYACVGWRHMLHNNA